MKLIIQLVAIIGIVATLNSCGGGGDGGSAPPYVQPPPDGTKTNPFIMTGNDTGQIDANIYSPTNVYYVQTGLIPGAYYGVYLTNTSGSASLYTYGGDSSYGGVYGDPDCYSFRPTGIIDSCISRADFTGELYVKVYGAPGSSYTLTSSFVSSTYLQSQGSLQFPIPITAGVPTHGTVSAWGVGSSAFVVTAGTSHYFVTGLAPGAHTVTVSNMTDDVDLYVRDDSGMATGKYGIILGKSISPGLANETLSLSSVPTNGNLVITVSRTSAGLHTNGATFTVTVQ